ncbi:hypothetical protein ACE1SV_67800 [Streptomyces sennicomposti]
MKPAPPVTRINMPRRYGRGPGREPYDAATSAIRKPSGRAGPSAGTAGATFVTCKDCAIP